MMSLDRNIKTITFVVENNEWLITYESSLTSAVVASEDLIDFLIEGNYIKKLDKVTSAVISYLTNKNINVEVDNRPSKETIQRLDEVWNNNKTFI